MATPNIVPRADSEGGLGTSSKYWASAYIDLIYVGAGKMGRDADNLIDFSTDNNITFRINNNNELTLDSGQLYPVTNNGLALGAAGYGFSDLYLANGAVIKFDNGDVTLTHSSGSLTLADSDALGFGNSNDLKIQHDGSDGYLTSNTGHFYIEQKADDSDIIFTCDDGSGGTTPYLTLDGGAGYTIASKTLNWLDGVYGSWGTSGDLLIFHSSDSYISNNSGALYIQNLSDDNDIIFRSDDGSGGVTEYFRLDGGSENIIVSKRMAFIDNAEIFLGTGSDFYLWHNGSNTYMYNNTGDFVIQQRADNADITFGCDDGAGGVATYFYLDGSSATHDGSATTNLFTNWPDKSTISLGTSHDFRIQHNGAHTELTNSEGNLTFIQHKDDGDIIFQCDDGSNGVETYFFLDGSESVVTFPDNKRLTFGTDRDLFLYHTGSDAQMKNYTGQLTFTQEVNDGDIVFKCDDGSGGTTAYLTLDGGLGYSIASKAIRFADSVRAYFGNSNDAEILHNGTNFAIQNLQGGGDMKIINYVDDTDIIFENDNGSGGTTTYFRLDGSAVNTIFEQNARFLDTIELRFGTSNDLKIYHDSSHSYIDQVGTGDLYIRQAVDDKDIIFQCDDGSGGVETYFYLDGSANGSNPLTVFPDGSNLAFGSAPDTYLMHNGTDFLLDNYNSGNIHIRNNVDDKDIIFSSDDGSGGTTAYITLDGGDVSTIVSTIKVMMPNLPTSNPSTAGQLWNDSGTLKISAG